LNQKYLNSHIIYLLLLFSTQIKKKKKNFKIKKKLENKAGGRPPTEVAGVV
jgi:hypothetical protein